MTFFKRVLFWGLAALVLAALATMALIRFWHIAPDDTISIRFDPNEAPLKSDLALLLRRGNYRLQTCCSHSTGVVSNIPGALGPARRFEVRASDTPIYGGYRSELRLRPNLMGRDFWYQGRVLLPADWTISATTVNIMQWRGTRDIIFGESTTVPPLALDVTGNRWRVLKAWDDRWISPDVPRVQGHRPIASSPITPGQWTTWTFHMRWSPTSDGLVQIWKDGALLLDLPGPIGFNDLIGPYMKVGVYIPGWLENGLEKNVRARSVYFDELTASATRSGLPIPIADD
jgi:hypothetical protein